ncbi:Wall-associated kinase family protein [Rhynchospora pubera]|uniref:Wall-associated kinase family protein n=1 Tax=Rhynchospora pubera TaxID=906938 RepID=A0AAV8DU89_9POAL|nr:Wall-associated kinase family protein [Rhynchospora pubera]
MEKWRIVFLLMCVVLQTKVKSKPCSLCGTTTVPFPLSTDGTCGDPSYKVCCSANTSTLFFDTSNNSYPITSIFPSSQRLVISPSTLRNDSCISSDLTSNGIHLNASLPFNVTSSNTIMLLNCTSHMLVSPLNCSSNSLCHLLPQPSCKTLTICCTFRAGGSATSHMINISPEFCSAYRSYVNLDLTQPADTWQSKEGVELQWISPREPLCNTQEDCDDGANANCTVDPSSDDELVKRCFCVRPTVWNPISGKCVNVVSLIPGFGAALLVLIVGSILYIRQRNKHQARQKIAKEREEILNLNNTSGRSARYFMTREMKNATNNFSHNKLLGAGGFGEVYKGVLPDGTLIAVKCAKIGNTKSTDQVLNEVRILSQVNHRSLVRLLGCCVEMERPLMVYEFIPNGTLAEHLHGLRSPLSWDHRLSIAHQTAEGLAYLHFLAVPPIYHRDVKSTNILLDENLNAKVSDFGLSRLVESDLSHISTCAQGTLGYLDPEYYRNFQLTDKSDVYSFGVVLLELLTSQKAIDFTRPNDDVNLVIYIKRLVLEDSLMEAVDPTMKKNATDIELDTMKALGYLAMSCLEETRQNRPSMKEVQEEIELIMALLAKANAQNL